MTKDLKNRRLWFGTETSPHTIHDIKQRILEIMLKASAMELKIFKGFFLI
jgi:hypothetical protein